jgi:hypothetical protein
MDDYPAGGWGDYTGCSFDTLEESLRYGEDAANEHGWGWFHIVDTERDGQRAIVAEQGDTYAGGLLYTPCGRGVVPDVAAWVTPDAGGDVEVSFSGSYMRRTLLADGSGAVTYYRLREG